MKRSVLFLILALLVLTLSVMLFACTSQPSAEQTPAGEDAAAETGEEQQAEPIHYITRPLNKETDLKEVDTEVLLAAQQFLADTLGSVDDDGNPCLYAIEGQVFIDGGDYFFGNVREMDNSTSEIAALPTVAQFVLATDYSEMYYVWWMPEEMIIYDLTDILHQ